MKTRTTQKTARQMKKRILGFAALVAVAIAASAALPTDGRAQDPVGANQTGANYQGMPGQGMGRGMGGGPGCRAAGGAGRGMGMMGQGMGRGMGQGMWGGGRGMMGAMPMTGDQTATTLDQTTGVPPCVTGRGGMGQGMWGAGRGGWRAMPMMSGGETTTPDGAVAAPPCLTGQNMRGQGMGRGMMGQGMGRGMMGAGNTACSLQFTQLAVDDQAIDQHLANLQERLAITPDQTAAWEGYAQALRERIVAQIDARNTMHAAFGQTDELTNLDRRALHLETMETMIGHQRRGLQAYRTLRETLTDDQIQTLGATTSPPCQI